MERNKNVSNNIESIERNKSNNKKKIIAATVAIMMMVTIFAFASDVNPRIIIENGVQKVNFELQHNITSAQYKYYGYGYNVNVYDNTGKHIGYKYLSNADFEPVMQGSTEIVKIPVEKILDKLNIEDEYYYRKNLKIWLDGRLGIKVNGVLTHVYDTLDGVPSAGSSGVGTGTISLDGKTVPLNKDGKGIRNGLMHEYGVNWGSETYNTNLPAQFGINFTLDSIYKYDGYNVEYREQLTNKTVSGSTDIVTYKDARTITEYPVNANGYKYNGKYEIKKTDSSGVKTTVRSITNGESATVSLAQTASIYTIIFYYDKVSASEITKPVTVEVEFRENTKDGKTIDSSTTVIGNELSQFIYNSKRIDGYLCKGYVVVGRESKEFSGTSANFVIGQEIYSQPVSGKIKLIFIYSVDSSSIVDKCEPDVSVNHNNVTLTMKRSVFEKLTEIDVENVKFEITDYDGGSGAVGGTHNFKYFDIYFDTYSASYDITSKSITRSFTLPKSKFVKNATDDNIYSATIRIDYVVNDTCSDGKPDHEGHYGIAFETNRALVITVNLVDNLPPKAEFNYYTERKLLDGSIDNIYESYINNVTVISNFATDPNGRKDIDFIKYTFKDIGGYEYYVKLKSVGSTYILDEHNIDAKNIEFVGVEWQGNVKVKFKTDENWEVSQFVQDIDGLNNTYTSNIHPIELDLSPVAVLNDNKFYQYPYETSFYGKQNRTIELNSNKSVIAEYLKDMGISIDHSKDTWEIMMLDGQSTDSIKFENDYNTIIEDNKVIIKYIHLNNIKMIFKEHGRYLFRLQVYDSNGNASKWSEQVITIVEDKSPTVEVNANDKFYRDSSKLAKIKFYVLGKSVDHDTAKVENISYKYDSNNNGNFDDDSLISTGLTLKDVNIDGYIYKEVSLNSSMIGRYQFVIKVSETFGQETIGKHIFSSDYKNVNITKIIEIDNNKPDASLGTVKKNKIDVKIVTSGLSGTRNADVQNNLNNLKIALENQGNIEVGNIEVIDLAKRVNGMLAENAPTWRRVSMYGMAGDMAFGYIDNEPDFIPTPDTLVEGNWFKNLPTGVVANGWNGIEPPKKEVVKVWGTAYPPKYKDIDRTFINSRGEYENFTHLQSNYFDMRYGLNYVSIGNVSNNFVWDGGLDDPLSISAVSKEKIKDFDIKYTFSDFIKRYSGMYGPPFPPDIWRGYRMLLFNIKDANNYYVAIDNEFYYGRGYEDNYYRLRDRGRAMPENMRGAILKITNGAGWQKCKKIATFYGEDIGRVQQVGTTLKVYNFYDELLWSGEIPQEDIGGYIGLAGDHYGSEVNYLTMNISKLDYIENSSLGDAIDAFNWGQKTDKYVINLVENTKLDELSNDYVLNRTVGKLQEKEINLINVGVSTLNKTGLNAIVTKNLNNGTYYELGSINTNFNSASEYIKSKYTSLPNSTDEYVILGDKIIYSENYSDVELDPVLLNEYNYTHDANYFENGLGTISNNNKWIKEPIELFNKTGKYTLKYRVKDNPLTPDKSEFNIFNNYRKYSNEFIKNIYVHRKPIANFSIDGSFEANYMVYNAFSLASKWIDVPPTTKIYSTTLTGTWDLERGFTIPDEAFNIKVTLTYNGRYSTSVRINTDVYREYYDVTVYGRGDPIVKNLSNAVERVYLSGSGLYDINMVIEYEMYERTYRQVVNYIDVNVPDDAVNANFSFIYEDFDYDTAYSTFYADSVELGRPSPTSNDTVTTYEIPAGTDKIVIISSSRDDYTEHAWVRMPNLTYYVPNYSVTIPIIENSYDLDHRSRADKGIVEWEWKIVDKDGGTTRQSFTNKNSGASWIDSVLRSGLKWHDATVMLRVKDLEGAWSDWASVFMSKNVILDPDASSPEISIPKPIADFSFEYNPLRQRSERQAIHNSSYDPKGLTLTYVWKVYKNGVKLLDSNDTNIDNRLNQIILDNGLGIYDVSLIVGSSSGAISEESIKSFEVIEGNLPPVLNVINPVENSKYKNTIDIVGDVTDPDFDDIVKIYYKIDNGSNILIKTLTSAGSKIDFSHIIDSTSISEGSRKLTVWAQDLEGEVSNIVERNIVIDRTPPIGSVKINNDASYTNTINNTLNISASDNASGVYQMRIRNDSDVWGPWESYSTIKSNWSLNTTNGTRNVRIQFRDNVGNESLEYSDSIVFDNVVPTGGISINNGNAFTITQNVTLNLSYADAVSGVSHMRFKDDVNGWTSWETVNSTKLWTLSNGSGTKTVVVQYRDRAGNSSVEYSDTIIFDDIKPTGSIKINNDATYTQNQNVTLQLSASDNISSNLFMRLRNENGLWGNWESFSTTKNWTLSNNNGIKIVGVQYMDETGNISNEYTDNIIWDNTKPTGSILINNGDLYTIPQIVTLGIEYEDEHTYVTHMRLRNEDGIWGAWESLSDTKTWILQEPNGIRTVKIQFKDIVGNISDEYSDNIIWDNIIPTINIIASDDWSNDFIPVTIETDDAGGSGIKTRVYKLTSNTDFPADIVTTGVNLNTSPEDIIINTPGINYLHVYVEDNAGNKYSTHKMLMINVSAKISDLNISKRDLEGVVKELTLDGLKTYILHKDKFDSKYTLNVHDTDITDRYDIEYRVIRLKDNQEVFKSELLDLSFDKVVPSIDTGLIWYIDDNFEYWGDGIYQVEVSLHDNKYVGGVLHKYHASTDIDSVYILIQRNPTEKPIISIDRNVGYVDVEIEYFKHPEYSMYDELTALYKFEYKISDLSYLKYTDKFKVYSDTTLVARTTDFAGNEALTTLIISDNDSNLVIDNDGNTVNTDDVTKGIGSSGIDALLEENNRTFNYFINIRKNGNTGLNLDLFEFLTNN